MERILSYKRCLFGVAKNSSRLRVAIPHIRESSLVRHISSHLPASNVDARRRAIVSIAADAAQNAAAGTLTELSELNGEKGASAAQRYKKKKRKCQTYDDS